MTRPFYIETCIAKQRLVMIKNISTTDRKQYCLSFDLPAAIQTRQIELMAFLETSILRCILARPCQHSPKITRLRLKKYCRKTARQNWKLFRQQTENNIVFHLIPRSHSAAAVYASGVRGNIEKRNRLHFGFDIWHDLSILKLALRKHGWL